MRRRSRHAFLVLIALSLLVVPAPPSHALGEPHLQLRYGDSVYPNSSTEILGDWWFPPTNCPNRIRIEIEDRRSVDHFLGNVRPRFPAELGTTRGPHDGWFIASTVEVPGGIAAGAATLKARQRFQVKLPVLGCITLWTKSGRAPIHVAGAEGNDPPVISDVVIPTTMRQGETTTLSWTLSEPCDMTIALEYQFGRGRNVPVGNLVAEQRPGGPQSLEWDVALGSPLPPGDYTAFIGCVDAVGSTSAITIKRFYVGFGG